MRSALVTLLIALSLAPGAFASPGLDVAGSSAAGAVVSTDFTITEKTQVPGATLKPGSYSIRVVDKLADRSILEIDDAKGKAVATFLGLPGSGLPKATGNGTISYDSGATSKSALRGFSFPQGQTVEFVYPKAEAVTLAKANSNKIPAIDPESEGRVAAPSLSKGDMQVVTLWMLSTTAVGSDQKGGDIKAEKYQQQVAAVHPPRPAIKALPHTASSLPLLVLAGIFSLLAAVTLTYSRRAVV